MNLRWEVDIVTPNMTSERSFYKIDKEDEYIQYDLFVSHLKNFEDHIIKFEVFLNDAPLIDQDGFHTIEEAKNACYNWVVKESLKKKK